MGVLLASARDYELFFVLARGAALVGSSEFCALAIRVAIALQTHMQ